jgi:hypothetical protein
MTTRLIFASVVAVTTVLAWWADRSGFFIYFGYKPLFVISGLMIVAGIVMLAMRRSIADIIVVLLGVGLVVGSAAALPSLPNGQRKEFHHAASMVRPGMNVEDARAVLRRFDPAPFIADAGSETYRLRTNRNTEDHIILRVSGDGRVASVEFSPD